MTVSIAEADTRLSAIWQLIAERVTVLNNFHVNNTPICVNLHKIATCLMKKQNIIKRPK
jgi:hypothetical protein